MSEFVRDAIRKIAIASAFFFFALMAYNLIRTGIYGEKIAHDYAVYWRAANEPAQFAYEWWQTRPFPYMPSMLVWVVPLGFLTEPAGYAIIAVASIAAVIFTCRPYLSSWTIALALISPPMVRCIRNGQVTALLMALMLWACGTANRIGAGVAFGVIASIKPQLVIMAPLMLALNRDWRAFVSAGMSFVAVVVLSAVLFGPGRWAEWVGSVDQFRAALDAYQALGIAATPASVAERLGLNPLPFMLLGALAGGGLVFMCRDMEPLEKATAIGAGSLLAAPYALIYDLVVIVPFLTLCAMRGNLLSFVGMAAIFNPLPLLVAAASLWKSPDQNPDLATVHGPGCPQRLDLIDRAG